MPKTFFRNFSLYLIIASLLISNSYASDLLEKNRFSNYKVNYTVNLYECPPDSIADSNNWCFWDVYNKHMAKWEQEAPKIITQRLLLQELSIINPLPMKPEDCQKRLNNVVYTTIHERRVFANNLIHTLLIELNWAITNLKIKDLERK